MDRLESECNISTSSCQTPRECQARSTDYLKKTSMIQQSTPNASAKQCAELDLPQSGSEDEDETWLAEFAGSQDNAETKAAEAGNTKEATFQPSPTNRLCADPGLRRTDEPIVMPRSAAPCSIDGSECDLPGPLSRDDDEDSSPLIQDLDLADHVPCSNRDMTTFGHDESTLTQSGFLMATLVVGTDSKEWVSTGSTKITPSNQLNSTLENAHLTIVKFDFLKYEFEIIEWPKIYLY